jgi:hypothetical protein
LQAGVGALHVLQLGEDVAQVLAVPAFLAIIPNMPVGSGSVASAKTRATCAAMAGCKLA